MALNAVQYFVFGQLSRPADHGWHTNAAFIGGHFLATERGSRAMWPGCVLRPVIGRIPDDGVFGQTLRIKPVKHTADIVVMLQHTAAVIVGLGCIFLCGVAPLVIQAGVKVHAAGVKPDKERLVGILGSRHEVDRRRDDFRPVKILHPFLG